jgi:sterol 14-demethylase
MVGLIEAIMASRGPFTEDDRDLLDVLMTVKDPDGSPRFTADEITGMFISMMFAGHHTTSGTAAWTLIELLRDPATMAEVVEEIDGLFDEGGSVTFQALREIPVLDACIKEALRLHPPLILLLRVAQEDLEVEGFTIRKGDLVAATPAVSNRLPEHFPDPDRYDPTRYLDPRNEDRGNPWAWIPFGGGKHRCVGAAFAQMQLKAIFLVLLRRFRFEMAQPPETYRDDYSKMVIQLQQPCRAHVLPREA